MVIIKNLREVENYFECDGYGDLKKGVTKKQAEEFLGIAFENGQENEYGTVDYKVEIEEESVCFEIENRTVKNILY